MGNFREGSKIGAWVIGGIATLAAVYVVGIFAFGGANWITAPFRGEAEKRENTVGSGAFRQSTYEDFFNLCQAAQDAEASIEALEEEKKEASDSRKDQIAQSVTALKSSRASSINEYNSKAAQEHRDSFQDEDLPNRLNVSDEKTTCSL